MSALVRRSAGELSALLQKREVTSVEVTRAHLDRIAELDPKIGAFTQVLRDEALRDAERADAELGRGESRGPLHGLPISVKECFDFAGRATTLGIAAWREKRAEKDASLVTMLREAGAVILGRTNLSQTMLFAESRNPVFGQTANPFSLAHTPGGSSGGEAAAVASGMSPLGVGTDIGGSIRTPCHFSGICGIKPTLDRLPAIGQQTVLAGQEIVRSMAGPMARRVSDLTMLLRALDPARMTALDPRVPPVAFEDPAAIDVRGLRVGVYTDDGVIPPAKSIVRAVERAADVLRARGCEVVHFVPPGVEEMLFEYLAALSADGARTALAAIDGGEIDPVMKPLMRLAAVPPSVRRTIGRIASAAGEKRMSRMLFAMGEKRVAEVWRLTARLRAYRARVLEAMDAANIDVLLCPAYATCALPHGMSKNFVLASSYTILWNATQFPAGAVPVTRVRPDEADRAVAKDGVERHARKIDRASAGLPVGVQVVARPWQDAKVLAVMSAIEAGVEGEAPATPVDPA